MIPTNVPTLERFCGSLVLAQGPAQEEGHFEIFGGSLALDGRTVREVQRLYLRYDPDAGITPEAAVSRIEKELRSGGHIACTSVAKMVLGLFAAARKPSGRAVEVLNELLSTMLAADVEQHLVARYPIHPGFKRFSVGDFTFGQFDHDRVAYWCDRIGCDYFARYPSLHRGKFAVSRGHILTKVLDLANLEPHEGAPATAAIQAYFDSMASYLFRIFREEAWEVQEILVATGSPFIDMNSIDYWQGGTFIAAFKWNTRIGFFCPLGNGLIVNYAEIDERIPQAAAALQGQFGFAQPADHEVGQTIRTFAHFVAKARLHEVATRTGEAFLHYVIALDLLFGDKNSVTRSLVRRAAVCVAGDLVMSYVDATKLINDLYETRSRYVHSGKPVEESQLKPLEAVCRAVLNCLLRYHCKVQPDAKKSAIAWWQRQLDYVAGAIEADKRVLNHELTDIGLLPGPNNA